MVLPKMNFEILKTAKVMHRYLRRRYGKNLPLLGWAAVIKSCALLLGVVLAMPGTAGAVSNKNELIRDLRFGTSEKREIAADEIRRQGISEASPALIEVLPLSQGVFRLKVIHALGELGDAKSAAAIEKIMIAPENDTRILAARALGKLGSASSEKVLLKALKDSDFEVRAESARALGRCGSSLSVNGLIELLKDSNGIVRLSAIDALGELGDGKALDALVGQIGNTDRSHRRHVIKAVGKLKASEKVDSLMTTWLKSKDVYMRGFAAEALAAGSASDSLAEELMKLLQDSELGVRIRAIETLGTWKYAKAAPALREFLRDDHEIVRWKAAWALGSIGDAESLEALRYTAEQDAMPDVKRMAEKAILSIEAR